MRTYYVTIAEVDGEACVHVESWVRDGQDAECSKGRVPIRATAALRDAIMHLSFTLDECPDFTGVVHEVEHCD